MGSCSVAQRWYVSFSEVEGAGVRFLGGALGCLAWFFGPLRSKGISAVCIETCDVVEEASGNHNKCIHWVGLM